MTLRVCLNISIFLLFPLSRQLSPFRLHEHVLSLLVSKLFIISLHSLYKFHVSCFVFSHFNSLPPASLSLMLLHFNCDFHGYLTRSRSTCIKCRSGINLLLVLKPRQELDRLLAPIIWKDSLFITSVWRFLQPGGVPACSQRQISIYSDYHSSSRRGTAFLQNSLTFA